MVYKYWLNDWLQNCNVSAIYSSITVLSISCKYELYLSICWVSTYLRFLMFLANAYQWNPGSLSEPRVQQLVLYYVEFIDE